MNKEEFIGRWAPGDVLNGDLSYYDFKSDLESLLQETACRVKAEVEDGYRFLSQALNEGDGTYRP